MPLQASLWSCIPNAYDIHIDTTEAFLDPELDERDILHLDLRRTRTVFGGNRKKKGER